jgi:hypothetical protein
LKDKVDKIWKKDAFRIKETCSEIQAQSEGGQRKEAARFVKNITTR